MLGNLPPRVFVEKAFDIAAQVLRTVRTGTDFSGMEDDECSAVPV